MRDAGPAIFVIMLIVIALIFIFIWANEESPVPQIDEGIATTTVQEIYDATGLNLPQELLNDPNFKMYDLGSTDEEVKVNCEKVGGVLSGTDPEAEAGTFIPTCFVQGEGYFPVYYPSFYAKWEEQWPYKEINR